MLIQDRKAGIKTGYIFAYILVITIGMFQFGNPS